jgi:predicted PurR-regulated permease PerM
MTHVPRKVGTRPIIFARGLKTPMLVIIVGVIGGTLSNGIIGLFVGPIVLAVAWDLLVAFVRETDAGWVSKASDKGL